MMLHLLTKREEEKIPRKSLLIASSALTLVPKKAFSIAIKKKIHFFIYLVCRNGSKSGGI